MILKTAVGCDSNSKILTRRNEVAKDFNTLPSFLRVKKCFHQMGELYLRGTPINSCYSQVRSS